MYHNTRTVLKLSIFPFRHNKMLSEARRMSSGSTPKTFNLDLIKNAYPRWPDWMKKEMASNHAGEVGAVNIYRGANTALWMRSFIFLSPAEMELKKFCARHLPAEEDHLRWILGAMPSSNSSWLIPLWHLSGRLLGFVAGICGPRIFYVVTETVETFVEKHYNHQIKLLEDDNDLTPEERQETHELLTAACADEVHHKEEAAGFASHFQPRFYDPVIRAIVDIGSSSAASAAKYI